MSATVPVHPDLQELWRAAVHPDGPPTQRRRASRLAATLICTGLFLLGFGVGGIYRSLPNPPTVPWSIVGSR